MCLGLLCEVIAVGDGEAVVRHERTTRTVSLMTLTTPVSPGDWLVVHSGFALAALAADEALSAHALRSGIDPDQPTEVAP